MALFNDTPTPTKPLMAGCQQEPCCASFVAGQWVAEKVVNQPCIAKVKEVHAPLLDGDGWTMDLVLYSYKGEKLGRVSDHMGGPKKFEPSCPCENYARIETPEFPVRRNLMGEPVSLVWHNVKRVHPYQRRRTSTTGLRL